MRDPLGQFWVHTATVETFLGQTGDGVDEYASPVTVVGFASGQSHVVRGPSGDDVISQSTFYTTTDQATVFTADSRVTIGGVTAHVITVNVNDSGPLGLPDHLAVSLT